MKTYLFTGGAGFVGSHLAVLLKQELGPAARVLALDNLKRRGSELNLPRLRNHGVEFMHGDIRNPEDLESVEKVDVIVECSAEPSVLAGYSDSPQYLIQTNLSGTVNCLEVARKHKADFVFLSTSRVYPIQAINGLNYVENETRFSLGGGQNLPGVSDKGFSEQFPLEGVRSLYGATKLCSEHLIREYVHMYGIRAVINRCGVLTGPWQMGKVDQGFVVLWVASHLYGKELSYLGFGGSGKQVRDILHVEDLFDLLRRQLRDLDKHNGQVYNVGGEADISVSLLELTRLCREITGKTVPVHSVHDNRPADIRLYLSDATKVQAATGWTPKKSCSQIVEDVSRWIIDNKASLQPILGK